MMDKPKRKNDEPNRWERFLDIVLLAMPFAYEMNLSPEDCAKQLQELARPKESIYDSVSREVKIHQLHDQGYDFELSLKHHGRSIYTGAEATGRIFVDVGIEKTVIKGTVSIGGAVVGLPFYFFVLALIFVPIVLYPAQLLQIFCVIVLCLVIFLAVYLVRGLIDLTTLLGVLDNAFSAKRLSKKKKNNG